MTSTTRCYLGIDVGTQGLTALLVESNNNDEASTDKKSSLNVLAIGEGSYDFVPDLPEGCYEHDPVHWEIALLEALRSIQGSLKGSVTIDALCVTGQMHRCVMIDENGKSIGTARLWCDARNQEEVGQMSWKEGCMIRFLDWILEQMISNQNRCTSDQGLSVCCYVDVIID